LKKDVLDYANEHFNFPKDYAFDLILGQPYSSATYFQPTTKRMEIFSGILSKSDAGGAQGGWRTYFENVSVADQFAVDHGYVNITVIEINHAPNIVPIGVQTVWTVGDNGTFYHELNVSDLEDGNRTSGNLDFNISFSNQTLFNISNTGVMNFTANSSHLGPNETSRMEDIAVCVSDRGLLNPHPNLTLHCLQDGSNMSSCDNFTLTITQVNRPPVIIDNYPDNNFTISITGTDYLNFNITKYDPDSPAIDTYWYVDSVEREYDPYQVNVSSDYFSYIFGCGVEGSHNVRVMITDGALNDTLQWNFSISLVPCSTGGGGGGGRPRIYCEEKWGCGDWATCRHLKKESRIGNIDDEFTFLIKERCSLFDWGDDVCGFQTRDCFDVNKCDSEFNKPPVLKECYYTEVPTCFDEIKNCHSGSCEVGIDCGGPCDPCPTCSDGKQNQGEEGVDCGGPCPDCKEEKPSPFSIFKITIYSVIIFLIIFAIVVAFLLLNYIKKKQRLETIARRRRTHSE